MAYAIRVNLGIAILLMVKTTSNSDTTDTINIKNGTCPASDQPLNSISDTPGELDWDADQKNTAVGCFFVGYVLTQLGGRFAELYGGKLIFGIGILITSLFTLLMPLAATTHFYLFVFFRGIVGFGQGVTMPVMHVMLANWAPPSERSQLSTFIYGGTSLGTVVSLLLTGPLCEWLGWEAAFYVSGGCGLVWFIFWSIFVYDTPAR